MICEKRDPQEYCAWLLQGEKMKAEIQVDEHLVAVADLVASLAHRGQVDHSGVPYIEHPRTVAGYVHTTEQKVIALLHDTLEDTCLTEADLRPVFGDEITDTVVMLTHDPQEDYAGYIDRVSESRLASAVKLADLRHNMQLSRLSVVTEADWKRIEKYKKAYAVLTERWQIEDI